jgi:hypothetical protein
MLMGSYAQYKQQYYQLVTPTTIFKPTDYETNCQQTAILTRSSPISTTLTKSYSNRPIRLF